jgi:hypothetical protein
MWVTLPLGSDAFYWHGFDLCFSMKMLMCVFSGCYTRMLTKQSNPTWVAITKGSKGEAK